MSRHISILSTPAKASGSSLRTARMNARSGSTLARCGPASTSTLLHIGSASLTNFSSVGMHVASVAKYLPNEEPDDEPYHGPVVSKKPNPVEQTATKARLAELQAADALQRSIVWGADGLTDEDADGEADEDCLPSLPGSSVAAPRSAPADVAELVSSIFSAHLQLSCSHIVLE
jgi:hypothetical protein